MRLLFHVTALRRLFFYHVQKMPHKSSRSINLVGDDDDDALSQYSKAPDSDDRELEYMPRPSRCTRLTSLQDICKGRCRVQGYVREIHTANSRATPHTVTWQKQKKEKEKKFLKTAHAELDEHVRALGILRRDHLFTATFSTGRSKTT